MIIVLVLTYDYCTSINMIIVLVTSQSVGVHPGGALKLMRSHLMCTVTLWLTTHYHVVHCKQEFIIYIYIYM